jgi:hypothetical protein
MTKDQKTSLLVWTGQIKIPGTRNPDQKFLHKTAKEVMRMKMWTQTMAILMLTKPCPSSAQAKPIMSPTPLIQKPI